MEYVYSSLTADEGKIHKGSPAANQAWPMGPEPQDWGPWGPGLDSFSIGEWAHGPGPLGPRFLGLGGCGQSWACASDKVFEVRVSCLAKHEAQRVRDPTAKKNELYT